MKPIRNLKLSLVILPNHSLSIRLTIVSDNGQS
jgi:hypothetical protein